MGRVFRVASKRAESAMGGRRGLEGFEIKLGMLEKIPKSGTSRGDLLPTLGRKAGEVVHMSNFSSCLGHLPTVQSIAVHGFTSIFGLICHLGVVK